MPNEAIVQGREHTHTLHNEAFVLCELDTELRRTMHTVFVYCAWTTCVRSNNTYECLNSCSTHCDAWTERRAQPPLGMSLAPSGTGLGTALDCRNNELLSIA